MDSILPYWACVQNKIEEVQRLEKEIKTAAVNKLTEGFETLVIGEEAISGDSGHRYGNFGYLIFLVGYVQCMIPIQIISGQTHAWLKPATL